MNSLAYAYSGKKNQVSTGVPTYKKVTKTVSTTTIVAYVCASEGFSG